MSKRQKTFDSIGHLFDRVAEEPTVDAQTLKFIADAEGRHGKRYDYSKAVYAHRLENVTIICRRHGPFPQSPKKHLTGQGCPRCGRERTAAAKVKSLATFLVESKEAHGNRYGYEHVVLAGYKTPVWIVCATHGKFKQIPELHVAGSGCTPCALSKNGAKKRNAAAATFIARAHKIHGRRYDYSKIVYVDAKSKVTIVCREHGDFTQVPPSHLAGSGCPDCGNDARHAANVTTKADFIRAARQKHGNRFGYKEVRYVNARTTVLIRCPKHGLFPQAPYEHLIGRGCRKCSTSKRAAEQAHTLEEFIAKAIEVHGSTYVYDRVRYTSQTTVVEIECRRHGVFSQLPSNHLSGKGCSKCTKQISRPEIAWLDHLGISERQTMIRIAGMKPFPADGFDQARGTIYLFHGDYWHGNPARYAADAIHPKTKKSYSVMYERTMRRDQAILAAGYNLITVWEADWRAQVKAAAAQGSDGPIMRRGPRLIEFQGETMPIAKWSKRTGIPLSKLIYRFDEDWPVDEMLGFKPRKCR